MVLKAARGLRRDLYTYLTTSLLRQKKKKNESVMLKKTPP